ncbi:MAG: hypothetical protein A2504_06490 [Bdellovibrionales bacterium RIFOXYD12_FULL_39_22]|nr:MAG: hypothetical protein A2385_08810 [Bdellovibrionales bacterium RIFOXYB1_FULL_39_21]OFZ45199.1 MAG: hypothetical protein A2485_05725 [Bdellovibrionales bacterium RIFOXYC12_FULL_39_17]OFZ45609.1 MAG: hypothetical protein A2404_03390 [Bdellovibrionales bacterium RIFOXYC1_FULL_39_130]OFZ70760.1 MAG: hypothetical protein A2451_05040 [Bdellovibrionales bacterium RIFOXYC2_FULL_39_8]OFZ77471.1 MAG: hypothetical protein A2560_08980 [Bdellovibrionales bacterium RIFOXYD1_FULL_39_84]OFZ91600.1 MAG:
MNSFIDPIIACATGLGTRSAIAIIRISGFAKIDLFFNYFSKNFTLIAPRISTLVDLLDNGEILDNVLATYFPAPHSYTGENILEISTHGNPIIVNRVINLFITQKLARQATAGEFTSRALANKKLTLNQVEGLELLLNGRNELMCTQGQRALRGELSLEYERLYDDFKNIKMAVELSIDFLEDVGEQAATHNLDLYIKRYLSNLLLLYNRANFLKGSFYSPQIVLIGETNAGKSSLFNNILAQNRSIVSQERGTTRDYISEVVTIGEADFVLIDTAGFRDEINSAVEREGVNRSDLLFSSAYFKVLVINPTEVLDHKNKIYLQNYDLIVFTHADLPNFVDNIQALNLNVRAKNAIYLTNSSNAGSIGPKTISGSIGPKILHKGFGPIEPAINPAETIKQSVLQKYRDDIAKNPIIITRHQEVINRVFDLSEHFLSDSQLLSSDISILASNLALIEKEIASLIGIITVDDLLSSIFSNFCIGK